MRATLLGAVAGILVLTLAPVDASHCVTYSTSRTDLEARTIVIEVGEVPTTDDFHYAYYDACHPGCLFSFGTYQESNGIPGLQRGDGFVNDTCHGLIPADVWTG